MDEIVVKDECELNKPEERFSAFLSYIVKIELIVKSFLKSAFLRSFLKVLGFCFVLAILLFVLILLPSILQHRIKPLSNTKQIPLIQTDSVDRSQRNQKLEKELVQLEKKILSLTPRSYYLVINSAENEFFLCKGKSVIREGKCSTGSYILLQNGDRQKWLFKTPRGEFHVQHKKRSPVWKKPDWAFIEEGLPVPALNHSSRFEYGVLGDYALSLGDGYLIHGTLYQRFLGLPVTHGCIRLNDEDLELIYRALNIGSKVYIY